MDEILQKLLQSDLLSEETRTEITQSWATHVEAFKTKITEEVSVEVRAQLAEQWIGEREELVENLDAFLNATIKKEFAEMEGDIESFRDLEAEKAAQLVEEKARLAEEVGVELDQLVEKLNDFLEQRIGAELEELKEDLAVARENDFGRQMFEAFSTTFNTQFVDEKAVQGRLKIAESKLHDAELQLARVEGERKAQLREAKMTSVLSQLTGSKREQMEMILKSVATERLEESYGQFIGRVLKESAPAPETKPLLEGAAPKPAPAKPVTKVVTGEKVIAESKPTPQSSQLNEMRALAGLPPL